MFRFQRRPPSSSGDTDGQRQISGQWRWLLELAVRQLQRRQGQVRHEVVRQCERQLRHRVRFRSEVSLLQQRVSSTDTLCINGSCLSESNLQAFSRSHRSSPEVSCTSSSLTLLSLSLDERESEVRLALRLLVRESQFYSLWICNRLPRNPLPHQELDAHFSRIW